MSNEDLHKLSDQIDGVFFFIINAYNEVNPNLEIAQHVVTGLLTGWGISEKNIVKTNIVLSSINGEFVSGTNEELEFESFEENIYLIRRDLSEKIYMAFLF